jgi:MYXO-CTERM domain-containing protein
VKLLALVALALLPAVAAQAPGIYNPTEAAPVELYFHLDGFQEFPINTQAPPDSASGDIGPGILGTSSSCLPGTGATGQSLHTMRGFSSPSYVEYGFIEQGMVRLHPERGLSYDVDIEGSPVLHWFLSTDPGLAPEGGVDPATLPLLVPQAIVEATLRTGGGAGPEDLRNDTGTLLGSGRSAPAFLAGPLTPQASPEVEYATVDGRPVYHFQVPLTLAAPVIPAAGGFTLRVDTRIDLPACSDGAAYLAPSSIKAHTSPAHRPRLSMQVHEAVRIEYLHPQRVGDQVFIHTALNSPFGNYDVNETALRLRLDGPTPATSLRPGDLVQRTHEHGHHTEAVDQPWIWDYRADHAEGAYTIVLEAANDQGSATARAVGRIEVGDEVKVTGCGSLAGPGGCAEETQDISGNPVAGEAASAWPAAGLALAMLGAASWRRRRR